MKTSTRGLPQCPPPTIPDAGLARPAQRGALLRLRKRIVLDAEEECATAGAEALRELLHSRAARYAGGRGQLAHFA